MTLCFECKSDQDDTQLAVCVELGHDIDTENLFQATTKTKENPVNKLIKFAETQMTKVVLSQSDNSRVYAVVNVKNHFETIELDKKNHKTINWLMATSSESLRKIYSEENCANAIGFLKARALLSEDITREEIHLRMALVNDEIYYDLGRNDWKFVKITRSETTLVDYSNNLPMFFRTSKISLQVDPNFSYDGNPLDAFVELSRISNPELFKVQLISMFIAGIPIPIMGLHGHAGASKSTTSSMTKRTIDPSGETNESNLKAFPHGEDNFVISLSSSYFSGFENISHIDVDISNMLCRAITGGSFEKRAQYTNDEIFTVSLMRKILINGVDFTISHSDLADRTIIYDLERITDDQRKPDDFIEESFKKLLPDLLGCIFLTLQKALGLVDNVKKQTKKLPRMASFGIIGEAIYQALGHKQGDFLILYNNSIKNNLEELFEHNPIIPCLEHVLGNEQELDLQANDLYVRITNFAKSEGYNLKKIPQGSNGLYNWFTRSKTLFDGNNINVTRYSNKQSKEVSGFTPNATIYQIKRVLPAPKNGLEL